MHGNPISQMFRNLKSEVYQDRKGNGYCDGWLDICICAIAIFHQLGSCCAAMAGSHSQSQGLICLIMKRSYTRGLVN